MLGLKFFEGYFMENYGYNSDEHFQTKVTLIDKDGFQKEGNTEDIISDYNELREEIENRGIPSGGESGQMLTKASNDDLTVAVSYIFECLDHFSPNMQDNAVRMNGDRHKKMWRYFMTANQDDPATKESREIYERIFSRKKEFQAIKEEIEKELKG